MQMKLNYRKQIVNNILFYISNKYMYIKIAQERFTFIVSRHIIGHIIDKYSLLKYCVKMMQCSMPCGLV